MNPIKKYILDYIQKRKDEKWILAMKKNQEHVIKDPKRFEVIGNFQLSESQKKSIDEFYLQNYGEKIEHTCHLTYTAYSGKFSFDYMPETICIPEFEHFMNLNIDYCKVFDNKNILSYIANANGIKTPYTYFKCINGIMLNNKGDLVKLDDVIKGISGKKVFIKPTVESGGGNKCELLDTKDIHEDSLRDTILSYGNDFVIQEVIKCSNSLSKIYPLSVNTFRVITYRWINGIELGTSVLRIGVGGMRIDNVTSGGIFIGINDDGTLLPFATDKYGKRYTKHPDTKVSFDGYLIEKFPIVLEAAIKLHSAVPQIGIAHWDFTIDDNEEVVLIEGNFNFGSVKMCQVSHGRSPFGKNTASILKWIRKMKEMPISERSKHLFGN